ncbi:MAG TPA: MarR family transcriptional regulator [Pseudonocardiaceae bacterium]|jgi:DNA-binding MarR family transcriptional regulator|nr:MarR family transcriptional regulator [Pseudonocardiaceae bacterium]
MRDRDDLLTRIEQVEERLVIMTMRQQSSSLLDLNLTVQQCQVLIVLWIEGPVPAHVIAEVLHVGANAVTGIVDRLVGRGLVERHESTQDRRVRLVDLSAEGRRLVDDLTAAHRAQRRVLLERLSTETLRQFADILTEMAGGTEN